jgi:hypothetical protein
MVEGSGTIDSGVVKFRPKARLLYLLGHELITDEVIAVVELVKNSHDADATKVTVKLTDVTKKSGGTIEIKDDGHGMTLDVVRQAWMEPARENKKKDEGGVTIRTKKFNRLPLGEKGVGRFSVDKLGLKLELITRFCEFDEKTKEISHLSDEEVTLIIEGKKFREDSYLDEIEFDWSTRKPVDFPENNHGTLLRIRDLRTPWTKEMVEKVQLGLARLSSPFSEAKDFEISFISNEFPELPSKIENPLLNLAPWVMDADINSDGIMYYKIQGSDKVKTEITKDLREGLNRFFLQDGKKGEYRKPLCGPFKYKLYGYEKKSSELKKYGIDKEKQDLLNEVCGVSIYRDGFRVWPYGEKGNDWLFLDKKRIQNTSLLGNDRVIGYIEISKEKNQSLRDKTNREGLIEEGNAFEDLRELAGHATDILSMHRYAASPHKKRDKSRAEEGKEDVESGSKQVEESASKAKTDMVTAKTSIEIGDTEGAKRAIDQAKKETDNGKKGTDQIKIGFQKVMEELKLSEDQIENLISLSGIGMTAERMTHELSKAANNATKMLKETVKILDSGKADIWVIKKNLSLIDGQLAIIRDYVRRMEPLYYSKGRNTEKLDVAEIAKSMKDFYKNTCWDLKIDVDVIEDSKLVLDINKGHLMQVFNNLFDNSFFWLEHKPPSGKSRIIIKVSGKGASLIFADNGPGVEDYVKPHIFDAFITTKTDGRGLGLFIVEDILSYYKAEIELMAEGKILDGANFKITFQEGKLHAK